MKRLIGLTVAVVAASCLVQAVAPSRALAACTIVQSNITRSNDPNQAGAVVTFSPAVTGTCGSVTCSPASGTFFPAGASAVICTGSTAGAAGFRVTVNDTQPPSLDPLPDITQPNDAGLPGAVVSFTATATDNVPGVTLACTPPSGNFFEIGTTDAICTATDRSGNTATRGFKVKVNDVEPPVLRLPGNQAVLADTGQQSRPISYPPATATDNSGATVSATCIPASNSVFALGTTAVGCTATDPAGNTARGSFEVSLLERLPGPGVVAPELLICGSNPQRLIRQRSLRVCIGSTSDGTARASATLAIGGVRKPVVLAERAAEVGSGKPANIKLPLGAKTRQLVRKALSHRRRVRATVKASVTGPTGALGRVTFPILAAP